MFSLETVTFYCKINCTTYYMILYTCGLLGYWESINSHSWV